MMTTLALTSFGNNSADIPWGKSDGSSLTDHIRDCLKIFNALKTAIPMLEQTSTAENFWSLLFWTVCLHDLGKLHPEFQNVLKKRKNLWAGQRHELYSVPFIRLKDGWLVPETDMTLIRQVVLAHHKDFAALKDRIKDQWILDMEMEEESKYRLLDHHPEDFAHGVQRIAGSAYFNPFIREIADLAQKYGMIGFPEAGLLPDSDAHPYESIAGSYKPPEPGSTTYWRQMMLWGALKICDHYGSAKIPALRVLRKDHFSFLDQLRKEHGSLYTHQEDCGVTQGNLILVSPTGSGKTEAAMNWLRTQLSENQGRAYLILPYTASINAMHTRLSGEMTLGRDDEASVVGVQHGKLVDYLYRCMEKEDRQDPAAIKTLADQYKKIILPLKIITPFQILKFAYGVKGFETGLAHLSGAKLIFDEIHAYDAITFAQLKVFLEFLIRYLNCRVMIMTATMPRFMLEALKHTLGVESEIRADSQFLKRAPRHKAFLLEGTIWDHMNTIKKEFKTTDKKILVVCNTVSQAQAVFKQLSTEHNKHQCVLLHSRFTSRDRLEWEKYIFNERTRLLVGTQAIEVSLDIDFDIMFTEPAPIDRLLQRFGRINRKYKKSPCPVHIFTRGGEHDHWIYPEELVEATLRCLEGVDHIYEDQIQFMMDSVYPNWPEKEEQNFNNTVHAFQEALNSLIPFTNNEKGEEEFYKQFTGVQVLPASLFTEYRQLLGNRLFVEADQLLVNLHQSGFRKLQSNNQILFQRIPIFNEKDKEKNHWVSIAQCRYDNRIGMTDEFEAFSDDNFF